MHKIGHGDGALRRHRITFPEANYFLTLCVHDRLTGLDDQTVASAVQQQIDKIESDGHWRHRCSVVMPDHLHLLIQITGSLSLSRCVGRLKSKTRDALQTQGLQWQPNFFEHRLRPDELVEPVIRYIYLNPYREKLRPTNNVHPWFHLCPADAEWFTPSLENGHPFPEWLSP